MEDPAQSRTPTSLRELEQRYQPSRRGWRQVSLGRLMLASNALGLLVAVIVKTQGKAIVVAVSLGVVAAFLAPFMVVCYIGCSSLYAWSRRRLRMRFQDASARASRRSHHVATESTSVDDLE